MAKNTRDFWLAQVGDGPRQANREIPSASAVYRHSCAKDGFPQHEAPTLYETFIRAVAKYPTNQCLGWRPKNPDGSAGDYVWKTYKEFGDEVVLVASGLKNVGACAKGSIGVLGTNCPEWMLALQVT
jgi:long-chain acyl-CoA synthetase